MVNYGISGFPHMGVPLNRWFRTENLVKMGDVGVPISFIKDIEPKVWVGFTSIIYMCGI